MLSASLLYILITVVHFPRSRARLKTPLRRMCTLDGLILLKLSDFPPQTLKSLFRGVPEALRDEVFQHFYGTTEV